VAHPIEGEVRQSSADRVLYYRELRRTLRNVLLPDLTSAEAIDAVGLIDRILAEFIVEEEYAPAVSAEFGARFQELLVPHPGVQSPLIAPEGFDALRGQAADEVAQAAGDVGAEAHELARKLVEVEAAFLERVDELRSPVLLEGSSNDGQPSASGCSVTAAQVTEYLRRRLLSSPNVEARELSVVPGGRSKETILVSLSGTNELPDQVILRKDRPVGVLATRAADEFAVIKAVHDFGGVPIPEPFFAEEEGHGLGEGTFELMERVRGGKAGEFFPDLAAPVDHRTEIGLQLAAALARLHSLPLDRLRGTRLDVASTGATEASIVGTIEAIVARINELSGPPCAAVFLARDWLLGHVPDVVPAPRLSLLQGDFGLHNVLVEGDRVTALVDWEAATIGPPARELAAAWNAATSLTTWPIFVDAYVGAGGSLEDCDPRAVSYYRVLSSLGAFMTSKMGGHLFRTGVKRDLLTAHSGLDSHFRCARNLARTLGEVMSSPP